MVVFFCMKHMLSDLKIHKRLVGDNLSGEGALANRLSHDYSAYLLCASRSMHLQPSKWTKAV